MAKTAYVLETDEHVMCCVCLKAATLFVVKTAYTGELSAVCQDHINIYGK